MKRGFPLCLLFGLLVFFGISNPLLSQQQPPVRFERYSSENVKLAKGLSQNWVYCILQDHFGLMWFGTWDGLNKFDGYNFTTYNVTNGLTDHAILCMIEDESGNLWLGTTRGLNKFDRRKQTFIQYPEIPGDTTSLFRNRINALTISHDGYLWLGTGGGLCRFDPITETFISFLSTSQDFASPRSNYIIHLLEDDKGNLWVSTTYGLVIFDPDTKRSTRYYSNKEDTNSLSNNNIRHILQDQSGNFWIATRNGLNHYDTTSQKITRYYYDPNDLHSINSNRVRVIYEDRNNRIWFGTEESGLAYFNEEDSSFTRFSHELNMDQSLSNNSVYSIYEDRSGNLWIGTYKGVNKINKYSNDFGLMQQTASSGDGTGLNNNFIWSFGEDGQNNLYIGTSNGVNIRKASDGTFDYLTHDPNNPETLAGNEVRSVLFTPGLNSMWFGLYGTGVDKYDLITKQFTHYLPVPDKNSLSDAFVNDLIQDHNGDIWIATGRGLDRLNPETEVFTKYLHNPDDNHSLSNSVIISLYQDRNNNLWVGTDRGLNRFHFAEKRFERFLHKIANDLDSYTFFSIYEDRKGRIWAGTSGGGLIRLLPETGEYKAYTTKDGLPNNIVYTIQEDEDGNLWFTGNWGLVKFYVDSEKFVTYDVKDGLQSYEFNLGAGYKDHSGTMYFGGMNGLNIFNPKDIKVNPEPPVVIVSAFRKFNEIQRNELFSGDTIRLRYDESFFSFEISALDFTNPAKNQYMYFLEGVDKDWVKAGSNDRLAEYKQVRPGRYTFYANGSNNDGVWNPTGLKLTVIIHPPWYGTWLFRILVALVLVSGIWFFIHRRIKNIRLKHAVELKMLDIEKQKFDLEQRSLRLQMNPHFLFNSLNSIQSYIVAHDPEMAIHYLGKFSQLMRLILTNSGNKFIPFDEEIKAITYYLDLEKLRFDQKFDYSIDIDPAIDTDFIEIPPMIVQPYIENAIIHGLLHKNVKGNIKVEFRLKDDKIHCTVTDDGIGRKRSAEILQRQGIRRQSSGMHITRARLELLNQDNKEEYNVRVTDLEDKHGNPLGTKVEMFIQFTEG
jgi:ligand-binding sensor domain-containing protein